MASAPLHVGVLNIIKILSGFYRFLCQRSSSVYRSDIDPMEGHLCEHLNDRVSTALVASGRLLRLGSSLPRFARWICLPQSLYERCLCRSPDRTCAWFPARKKSAERG